MPKILAFLDQTHAENPTYFYKNFTYENRTFDAAYEQAQIDLFKQTANPIVTQFIKHHLNEYQGWEKFVEKYYQGAQPQLLDGLPGMGDAIQQGGKTFNLNWADNKDGAAALIEYLKTL